ncbi:hypothetical protein CDL12_10417 [Handroanthus impetiginosus]|uniref:S-protein homolog n=1 Tax=Handroanthus impetiginosus TaxID=429701 RepID=A0A2G9HHC5_9LAMI|nr:hypothetical protein CDL12_10417 [Handroanthus impetiginosus]
MKNSITKERLFPLFFLPIYINGSTKVISSSTRKTFDTSENIKTLPYEKFDAYIHDSLPNNNSPLLIHHFSGDINFASHTLHTNEDFHWQFHMNIILSTGYFCQFQWGSKDKAYKVFNRHLAPNCEGFNAKDPNICFMDQWGQM